MKQIQVDENGNFIEVETVQKNWDCEFIRSLYKEQGKGQEWFDNLIVLTPDTDVSRLNFEPIQIPTQVDDEYVKSLFPYETVLFLAEEQLDPKKLEKFKDRVNEENYLDLVKKFNISLTYDN